MTRDPAWFVDGIRVDGMLIDTPTPTRGEEFRLECIFDIADDDATGLYGDEYGTYYSGVMNRYHELRPYLRFATGRHLEWGHTAGTLWVAERTLDADPVESHIVPVETSSDVVDVDAFWAGILGGQDRSRPVDDVDGRRRLAFDIVLLADRDEYETREDLLADLGVDP